MKLDKKDNKILSILDFNSRTPLNHIAKKVKLSKDAVSNRLKKLEKRDIINNYYTLTNLSKLGYISVRVYLKLFALSQNEFKKIINFLIKNNQVFFIVECLGNIDLDFSVWAKNIFDFEHFYTSFKTRFKKYRNTIRR